MSASTVVAIRSTQEHSEALRSNHLGARRDERVDGGGRTVTRGEHERSGASGVVGRVDARLLSDEQAPAKAVEGTGRDGKG